MPYKTRSDKKQEKSEDLLMLVQEEVSQAEIWATANIREDQERNLQYYLGLPIGNEIDGRSQMISWDVFEVIESALPSFIEPFFSGDNIGVFEPRQPQDEQYCEQATDVVNYIIKTQNPGFTLFNTWFKDALLSKIGIVRAEWQEQEPKRTEYTDLSIEQLTLLLQDQKNKLIERSSKPDEEAQKQIDAQYAQAMQQYQQVALQARQQGQPVPPPPQMPPTPELHSVTILQEQDGKVCIENVRPENFVVSRAAKSLDKARIVGEFVTMTRSEIAEAGYADAMDVSDFVGSDQGASSIMQMLRDDTTVQAGMVNTSDRSMEEVMLFRGFIRADVNGDGIAEYRYVLAAGDRLLEDMEVDCHDYAVLTPIPIPHRVTGMAYADPAADIQRLNTTLTRQYLDSLYAANNQRMYVNTTAGVNLDDLLNNRIGGIVRGTRPVGEAISPLTTTIVSRDALEGIQLGQSMRESRLGITRYNQGLDAESLNKTATGIQKVMGAADKRQLMTLRVLAETGVKDLFRLVLRLVTKYQTKAATVRLRGEWVQYDPRAWNPEMDCMIDVGIGSGDKTETLMMLQQFGQYMAWGQQAGVVTPQNVYEFGKALAKNGKLRGADTKLLTAPNPNPPPPPPSPEEIKVQAEAQKVQFQAQHQKEMKQMELQDSAYKFQAEQQSQRETDTNRQEMEARQKQLELQQQGQLEMMRLQGQKEIEEMRLAFEREKFLISEKNKREIAEMQIASGMQKHQSSMMLAGMNAAREDMRMEREDMAQESETEGETDD